MNLSAEEGIVMGMVDPMLFISALTVKGLSVVRPVNLGNGPKST